MFQNDVLRLLFSKGMRLVDQLARSPFGCVAQLVRAPSLYLGGPWFESRRTHFFMERIPKIKPNEAEQKAHESVARRRRVLDMARGEKAVEDLNVFLAENGLTEEDWKKLQKKLGQERKRMN